MNTEVKQNKIVKAFNYLIKDPKLFLSQCILHCARLFPDKLFLSMLFYLRFGYRINWRNPQTFNEKLQWLKLYNRQAKYTDLVDKYKVKKLVANIIGEQYVIPTIGIWDKVDDIDFNKLPNQFVLKCTHDCGVVICKEKERMDVNNVKKHIKKCLKRNYFYQNREWPYKNVTRRIIAEKFMVDESGYELKDYKFFCFNGEPKCLFVATDRGKEGEEVKFDFFDLDFNHMNITNGHPNADKQISKPLNYDKMVEIAKELSKGLPHVRVDLYNINGQIYFGELTFFHFSGMVPFVPNEWDYKMGNWLKLPI